MNSYTRQKLGFAVLALLAASATALAAPAPAPAPAADPDPQATPVASTSTTTETTGLEEVVVTGTRIKAPNIQAASPVVVITAKDIQLTGKTDVSDILYQLPQNFNNSLGQDFSNNTPGLTSAGGVTTADLRGLGPNRTLVLIDGIRLGYGSPNTRIASPAPDLDQIPSYMLDRVDVLTGGASATYGSDAIAGVVNFIMKKNFEGVQFDAQLGENMHNNGATWLQQINQAAGYDTVTGTHYTGQNQQFDIIIGTNFADNKGNITGYGGYLNVNPVTSGQYDFGNCQLAENDTLTGPVCSGSSNSNYFLPTNPNVPGFNNAYSVNGSTFVPRGSVATTPPAVFNSQPYITLGRQDERYQAGFLAHLELADYVKPYASFNFMDDKTEAIIAPSALFRGGNPLTADGNYLVNCSNPLLSAQEASLICTPAQIAQDKLVPGSQSADVEIGRRNIEGGGRDSTFDHTNYRAVVGSKGDFANNVWNYDAYASYYYTTLYEQDQNYLSYQGISNALQVTGTAANPVCIGGGNCVPYNIFNQGGVTQQQLAYLYLTGTNYGSLTERIEHIDFGADLGKYGVTIPWATDGIAINFGGEHRNDNINYAPDAAEQSGLLAGAGGAAVPIDNSQAVSEGFIEARFPIAQQKPWAQDLVFDAGYRYSDYSVSGAVNTYKLDLQWQIIPDLKARASFNRAIRAPSLIELYTPQNVGQIAIGNDPCSPVDKNTPATATLAQCEHTGVTPAQYGNGTLNGPNPNTIPQGTAGQLSQEQGGNPNLVPETSDSYTAGLVFTPTSVRNLTASIDWWRISLSDLVGTLPATIILSDCIATGNPQYCSQIVRNPVTGGLNGASPQSGGYIVQTNVNVAGGETKGIDISANYKQGLPSGFGNLLFSLIGTYTLNNTTTPYPGAPTYDCAGLYGPTCQTVNPRYRQVFRTTWALPAKVDLTLTWRYIGKVALDNNNSQPSLAGATFGPLPGGYDEFNNEIPAYNYFDFVASWNFWRDVTVRAGMSNIADKVPPIVTSSLGTGGNGLPNTLPVYDIEGRQLFIALTAKF